MIDDRETSGGPTAPEDGPEAPRTGKAIEERASERLGLPEPEVMFEEIVAMAALRRSTGRGSISGKFRSEHITQVLRLSEAKIRNEHEIRLIDRRNDLKVVQWVLGLIGLAVVALAFLCWLFFAYGKSDQVSDIIRMLIVGGGGVGIGTGIRGLVRTTGREKDDPTN